MTRIERSKEIDAPVEKVFAYLSNPKNQEKIFVDSEFKIEDVSMRATGVGTKFRVSAVIGGRKVNPHWHEFTEFKENQKIVDHEVKGGGGILNKENMTFAMEPTDKGTKLTIIEDYVLPYSVLGKLLDGLTVRKGFERFIDSGTQKAKEILEA